MTITVAGNKFVIDCNGYILGCFNILVNNELCYRKIVGNFLYFMGGGQ